MSTDPIITPEMIAAYADGELDAERVAMMEAAVAADPGMADLVAKHRALRARLSANFAPMLEQPVPSNLTALLQPASGDSGVASFAAARQRRGLAPVVRRWAPIAGPALAASLVLAMWQPWQGSRSSPGYARGALASALDTQLVATQRPGTQTRILLSFENAAGQYCRAYRGGESGGIACRDATGWKIERAFGVEAAQSGEYRQAGSESEILSAAQEMAQGGALDAAGESAARQQGWR
ncbi:hypothetical protein WAB17_09220 [Parerythrobacter aurantius]|uniref:anti-sigma factor family protein n=1 Tax=Parerythrobacter aurantius TaxID=3127706 RepID=UPI00325673E0